MNTKTLQDVLAWIRTTDLVEVGWKLGADGLEFRLEDRAPAPPAAFPASALVSVASPGVGLFRWSSPGSPRTALEGKAVAAGERLGLLETGGKPVEVAASASGRLVKILIDEGRPVEYGQALFLISPT